ncbi:hypothetical protein R3P38DRAFT_3604568, partial [Favolaschia claudopus]
PTLAALIEAHPTTNTTSCFTRHHLPRHHIRIPTNAASSQALATMNYIRQVVLHQEPKAAKPASTNINLSLSELPSAQLANASDVDVEEFEMSKTKTSSALPAELLINQSQTRSSLGQEMIDAPFVRTRKQDKTDAIDFTRTVEAVVSEIADAGKDGGQQDSADIWNERRLAFVGSRSRPDAGEVRLNLWWQWTRDRCARENAGLWKNITSSASECQL